MKKKIIIWISFHIQKKNLFSLYDKNLFSHKKLQFNIYIHTHHSLTHSTIFISLFLFSFFLSLSSPSWNRYRKRKLSFLLSVMVDGIWIQLICFNHCLSHDYDILCYIPFTFSSYKHTLYDFFFCTTINRYKTFSYSSLKIKKKKKKKVFLHSYR